jgi:hypothetical protein
MEKARVNDEGRQPGDDDSGVVERRESGGASEAKEFPRGDRRGDGEERRQRRASVQHDGDRDRCGDDAERYAACELGAQTVLTLP